MKVLGIDDAAFRELDTNIAKLDRMILGRCSTRKGRRNTCLAPELRLTKTAQGWWDSAGSGDEQMRATLLGSHSIVPKSLLRAIDDRRAK